METVAADNEIRLDVLRFAGVHETHRWSASLDAFNREMAGIEQQLATSCEPDSDESDNDLMLKVGRGCLAREFGKVDSVTLSANTSPLPWWSAP